MGEVGVHWTDFFVAKVGATAALSGLIIVAVSIQYPENPIDTAPARPGFGGVGAVVGRIADLQPRAHSGSATAAARR
jgi:hypothetical protein